MDKGMCLITHLRRYGKLRSQPEHERDWQRYAERAADYAFGVQGGFVGG